MAKDVYERNKWIAGVEHFRKEYVKNLQQQHAKSSRISLHSSQMALPPLPGNIESKSDLTSQ